MFEGSWDPFLLEEMISSLVDPELSPSTWFVELKTIGMIEHVLFELGST